MEKVENVDDYAGDIFLRLLQDEAQSLPVNVNYMEHQEDIDERMRAILIDWLVEVHKKYKLQPVTLFTTVSLVDRYLALTSVRRRRLQLVGVAAMLIAAKVEEIHPPEVKDFTYITDNSYTSQELLNAEVDMLNALDFKVVVPTAIHFLDFLARANGCSDQHRELARYLVDLSLLDVKMLRHRPAQLVGSAIYLSNELLNRWPKWPADMGRVLRCSEMDLLPCAKELRALLDAAPGSALQAVRARYSSARHHSVALLPCCAPRPRD
jgi:cyclin B